MSDFTLDDLNSRNKIRQKAAVDYFSTEISPEDTSKLETAFSENPKSESGFIYAIVLGRSGNRDVVDKMLLYLQDKNYSLQKKAELTLIGIGKNAVEPLIKATALEDDALLGKISSILRNMPETNVPLMQKMLESGTLPMKLIAAKVLGKIRNDDKILISLVKALANDDPQLDEIVLHSLVEAGEKIIPFIQKIFKNCNDRIARILMEALYRIGKPSLKLLLECLESPTLCLRRHAPYALRFANDVETLKKIVAALDDSDYFVCESAYRNLVINLKEAHYLIIKKLEENCSENTMHWLIKTLNSDFDANSEHILLYMKNPEEIKLQGITAITPNLKISLTNALAENLNPVLISRLIKMLGDPDFFVRENSLYLLAEHGRKFIPQIIMALGDPSEDIRGGLISILRIIRDEAFGQLIENLRTGNNEMRYNCAYALGFMENRDAIEPLKGALNDGNDWVREYAIMSLGKLGEAQALIAMLARANEQTKMQVSKALSFCGADAVDPLIDALKAAPVDKREPLAKAIMGMGESVKDRVQQILDGEDNENVRFWLIKVVRSFGKKLEI